MNKRKLIGLVLAYKSSNFGCQLQAFATQYIVQSLGFETAILDFRRGKFSVSSVNFDIGILRYLYQSRIERRIRKKTRDGVANAIFQKNKAERKQISYAFIAQNLQNILKIDSYKKLKDLSKSFFACIIGSDQKWLPGFCYDRISSLSFTPPNCRRISYATSLGVSDYPSYCISSSRKVWNKFDSLSVRESQGVNIVNTICRNNRCQHVLDPTYLISKTDWEKIFPVKRQFEQSYVLCYFLGNDDKAKLCAKRYAEANNIEIYSIMNDESFSDIDTKFADKILTNVSPEDFINLIRGAVCVFTDSFHGMTFSIINNIQFYIFYRKREDAKLSRNSRIDNILNMLDLSNRLISDCGIEWSQCSVETIDYNRVNVSLDRKIQESMSYLNNALLINED